MAGFYASHIKRRGYIMDMNYVKKNVIRQYDMPIPDIPEFYDYFLDLYEPLLKTRSAVNLAVEEIGYGDEFEYFKKIDNTRLSIINEINATQGYREFSDEKNPKFSTAGGKNKDIPMYLRIPTDII